MSPTKRDSHLLSCCPSLPTLYFCVALIMTKLQLAVDDEGTRRQAGMEEFLMKQWLVQKASAVCQRGIPTPVQTHQRPSLQAPPRAVSDFLTNTEREHSFTGGNLLDSHSGWC